MHAIRSLALPSRRTVFVLLGIAAALLLVTALVVEPKPRRLVESSTDSVAPSTEPADAHNAGGALVDPAVAPAPGGAARDASTGISAEEAAKAGVLDESIATDAPVATNSMVAPPELEAKIVRSANIELRVKRAGFEDAWGDAQAVATTHGGYIVAASRSGAGTDARVGTITMRVPTKRFDAAVDSLRTVSGAKVRRLDVASQDVTQEFVDVRSRLRHDRAVEARLLALLSQTKGVSEVLAVQAQLDQVQEQIELSKGRLGYLEKMTSMSTIEVTITAPAKAGADHDDVKPSVLSESLDDAKERFEANVAGAIVWLGGALPTLLLLGALGLAGRVIWRRTRREAPVQDRESEL